MHILDVLKPKSRPKYGRRKTIDGGSISHAGHATSTDSDGQQLTAWDPWTYDAYNAVDDLATTKVKHNRPSTAGTITVCTNRSYLVCVLTTGSYDRMLSLRYALFPSLESSLTRDRTGTLLILARQHLEETPSTPRPIRAAL